MDISTRCIKATPYKIVYSKKKVIGLFEYNKFISAGNFNEKHKILASEGFIDKAVEYAKRMG